MIVVSAYAETEYDVRELNAAAYLRKPVKLNELLRLVEHHSGGSRAEGVGA